MNKVKRQTLREEYAQWLERFNWNWFVTLTNRFRTSRSVMGAKLDAYVRRLGPSAYAVAGIESNSGDGVHGHLLIGGVENVTIRDAQNLWTHGFSRIERYAVGGGGSFYVSKDLDVSIIGDPIAS
jgi:hypothetical protein